MPPHQASSHPFDTASPPDWVLPLFERPTAENFNEGRYLDANPDVRSAIQAGTWQASGWDHFELHGRAEGRMQSADRDRLLGLRADKLDRLRPRLRSEPARIDDDGRLDYLTDELRELAGVVAADAESAMGYDDRYHAALERHRDDLVLDCGAGSKRWYWPNIVNLEIAPYPSTDVLGVGEVLPFEDESFPMVISVAVLEHVRDPFACVAELARVLRPGGELWLEASFMQPFHGYPDHYFNTTPSGVEQLLRDHFDIERMVIGPRQGPAHSISWMLGLWEAGLPEARRSEFRALRVDDLLRPDDMDASPFVEELQDTAARQVAAAFSVLARRR